MKFRSDHIELLNQAIGNEAAYWMPHFPFPSPVCSIKIYPWSPHPAPHEFLTLKYFFPPYSPYPTASTPWSSLVPHDPV